MRILPILLSLAPVASAQVAPEFKAPKNVGPGLFEIGAVKLDQNERTVSFPAKVNMVDGLVEYYLVRPEGAVHESVLVSDAQPQDVHMAMKALGAKGMEVKADAQAPARIDAEYLAKAPKLTGDSISFTLKWKAADGTEKTSPAEKWMARRVEVPKKPAKNIVAEEGPWLYTGSYFYENRFIAQADGVFAAVVSYPGALINNPRKGANDDHMWFVNTPVVPPKDTPVTVVLKINAPAGPAKDSKKEPAK